MPLLFFFSCANLGNRIGADSYADSVVCYQQELLTQVDTFFQSLYYADYDAVEYYWKAVKQLEHLRLQLDELGDFRNDDILYNESLNYCHNIDNLLAHEGKKLLELHEFKDGYGRFTWRKEIDSLLRASYHIVNTNQQAFDAVLAEFLDENGFDVVMDTNMTSKSNFDHLPGYDR
ncbi:hypothetical protein LJC68_01955 [Bacteroidales bacterium OttesenSCG-928-B11]|nr:hypothetical protein [Bacteroidales bacterium OttesenSCG-928-C03]MDL2311625.1 hypothetical protein [Bacteroidales bacterium OttesenSCG-928-B11]MDL2326759.1 hypothetical protein [Bacteroidales bacterium OttesenSCG-928-A14]